MFFIKKIKRILNFFRIGIHLKRIYSSPKIISSIPYANYICIVCIIKNESKYIAEWIEYHLLVGITHFYIYDNGSTDSTFAVLRIYIERGIVTYHYIQGSYMQLPVYNDAITRYKYQNQWMAFIDSDEFIAISDHKKYETVPDILKEFEAFPGLGVNWIMFDSNDYNDEPSKGFVIENFTRIHENNDEAVNRHIKSIVNPRNVTACLNYHFCFYKHNAKAVDEQFQKICGAFTKHNSTTKIRVNHYWSKSKAEFLVKINIRGYSDKTKRLCKKSDYSYENYKYDMSMDKYVELLKSKIPDTYGSL